MAQLPGKRLLLNLPSGQMQTRPVQQPPRCRLCPVAACPRGAAWGAEAPRAGPGRAATGDRRHSLRPRQMHTDTGKLFPGTCRSTRVAEPRSPEDVRLAQRSRRSCNSPCYNFREGRPSPSCWTKNRWLKFSIHSGPVKPRTKAAGARTASGGDEQRDRRAEGQAMSAGAVGRGRYVQVSTVSAPQQQRGTRLRKLPPTGSTRVMRPAGSHPGGYETLCCGRPAPQVPEGRAFVKVAALAVGSHSPRRILTHRNGQRKDGPEQS